MEAKFIKWVNKRDGSMPYILVEMVHNNERKIVKVDGCWEEKKEEILEYAERNWGRNCFEMCVEKTEKVN